VPQIEVSFDIDANGILHVSAKDKATGKEQRIQIKASSGLSEDEINNMVKDAEAHKEDDRKFHELVAARNQADNLIHATEKSLAEFGEEVSEDEKQAINGAIEALKTAMGTDDKDDIEAKTQALGEASGKLAERMYAKQAEQAGGEGGEPEQGDARAEGDDVVDAEFEEVDDGKK
jgi:molecular chaperone DnaK